MAKRVAVVCNLTRLPERRSPDPARGCSLDPRRVGDRISDCNASPRAYVGNWRVSVCNLLDTIVTGKKIRGNLTANFQVFSRILT